MPRRVTAALVLLAVAAAAPACVSVPAGFRQGARCSSAGTCPEGQSCSAEGMCLTPCTTVDLCTGPTCECRADQWSGPLPLACRDDHLACYSDKQTRFDDAGAITA